MLTFLSFIFSNPVYANGWKTGPSMPTGRSEIHAALLDNHIYVVGGIGNFRTLNSCERFSISEQRWYKCPKLDRRRHHVALATDGSRVFASGGYTSLSFKHDNAAALWSYTPGDKHWQKVSDLPEPIGEHVMTFNNNEILIIGGRTKQSDSAAVRAYNLETGVWRSGSDMPTPRHSMAMVNVDGQIWITGGRSSLLGSRIDIVEVYDHAADKWITSPPLPTGRAGHVAAYAEGKIHIFGGEVFNPDRVIDRHDVFDLLSQEWSTGSPLPKARHGSAAVSDGNRIWIIGGGSRPAMSTIYSTTGTLQLWTAKE